MIRRLWPDVAFVLLAAGLLAWVAWDAFAFRIITFSPGADYWEHTAVLHALLEDPWHPKHPLIVGAVASPRFGPHLLLVALVGRLFGADALTAMGMAAVFNTLLFLLGIWAFFRVYFRDARASLFGLVVCFGGWLDAPHFSNVYQLGVYFSVAGYPSTAALATTLLGLTLTLFVLRREELVRPGLVGLAFVWAYVYVTHPLTATMGLPAAALLAATEPGIALRRRLFVGGTVLVGLLLSALWPYYPALGMVVGGTAGRVKRDLALGGHELHEFYTPEMLWRIVGYSVLTLPLLPYFVWRRKHLIVPLGTALMLLAFVVSAFVPIPLGHRYVLLAMPFLHLGLVWLLLELVPREPRPGWSGNRWARALGAGLVGGFLSLLVLTNVLAARARFERISATLSPRESPTVRSARRIGELAGPDAVVLATPIVSWSIPTFGPKIVALHHRNPLIVDADERARDAALFFAGGTPDSERRAIIARYGITHVVAQTRAPSSRLGRFFDEHAKARDLPGRATLYVLKPLGPSG